MTVFLVNETEKPVQIMRNAKVVRFIPHQPVPVVDRKVADDIAFSNPALKVVEQKEEGAIFLKHSGQHVIVVRYENTTFPFPPNRYVEVESRAKADTIAQEFNSVSHSGVKFTVYTDADLNKLQAEGAEFKEVEFMFLPETDKPALIE